MKSIRLLVIAAIVSAWYTAGPSVLAQDVVTMPAVQKRIVVKVSAPAHVQAVSNAVLAAPTAGFVSGLRITPGETVRAGQTIAHLSTAAVLHYVGDENQKDASSLGVASFVTFVISATVHIIMQHGVDLTLYAPG
ncbi:acetyl/propionyl-CoA carboxylase alpha subunit [Paraburkholderia sp. WC7.3g]|uniref:hypothetical protein n=1 Tax=Paraburkholderia sp. WC7.3g TaxID=2991070 RepID=UPI003D1AE541